MAAHATLLTLRFRCPKCHESLTGNGTEARHCRRCGLSWHLTNGKWNFAGTEKVYAVDATDSLKSRLKSNGHLYAAAVNLLSPVYPQWLLESRRLNRHMTETRVVVDIGSGNMRWSNFTVNVDLMPYPNVDVVSEADNLPFENASVDIVVSIAMLEHVRNPGNVLSEIKRVLRPDGVAYVYVPFVQGFHAAPHDYQRFTKSGLEFALSEFQLLRLENFGPTSGLVWILAEWLSIVLCFGSRRIQRTLALAFMVLLSPLKFLDAALRHFPGADNISTGFLAVARKKRDERNA